MQKTFWGYRRENGRVGVRNHVIILPVDDLSNAAAEAVANNIKGTLALPHPYGRLQFGADLDCTSARSSVPAPIRTSPPSS
jgi:(2R)-sulfolactate sulfo-lyase subunit beta